MQFYERHSYFLSSTRKKVNIETGRDFLYHWNRIEETNMKTEFLADAGDLLGRYGLIRRDDWYSHKIEGLLEGKSVVVSVLSGILVHMVGKDGGLVFFTDQDAKSKLSEGDGSYISSFDYEAYLERIRVEEPEDEEIPKKKRQGGRSNLGQSLPQMLTSLNLIPENNTTHRRYFYDFLGGLGLLDQDRRPTQKAVEMGYVQEAEGVRSWYEWDMDFFSSQIGCDWLGGYMSKHKIHETLEREKYNLDKNGTLRLLADVMEPYSEGYMVPNRMAIESGKARLSKYYEWHPECLTRVCEYFLELKEISKSQKISLDEAKLRLSWMGEEGKVPGEENPMSLLEELDPECFERVNSIPMA